jgi:membrane-associated protein
VQVLSQLVSFILHIDTHLVGIIEAYGVLTYAILFLIIFVETGLIVTPFLPGDSLLFAVGALAAVGSLNLYISFFLLIVAAILGDSVNYWVGKLFGKKIVDNPKIAFVNQRHIDKAEAFYAKHGGKAILLARFVPIVRTFAPFVAGVGKMHYSTFFFYNVLGGFLWVSLFLFGGYFFGGLPAVEENFSIVVIAIILVSLAPMAYEFIKKKRDSSL